ncbi:3-hydroxyacyl-CoA dehydrogenase NAD-binding domain-containing protein [Kibdelosporangium phytohabitans]|uniref:L-gulonate 3-dehydrogenase n=1 Tax=Kibdelosporangium phytohabitans TaxID=860235 RepID=A0A0N7F433_9PSEU|nr:3-hydroxyacyl-CoA dehydrogenase NAD-binding domain-containing protein [Kibdelosporangium phytohabitans]ALG10311.1 hydroxylacyl-CoA dehydrogenase [Kibdelosporangium phytohabitans]MBE1461345.1 ketoreductase RED1 [Kibdelosporangium phytohabitans]
MTVPVKIAANIAVVGAGTIGLSWARLFASHGMTVRISDPRPDLAAAVAELPGDIRIAASVDEAVRDADVVQESGPEDLEFKKHLFATLVRVAPAHALLLSSSSAIPSTAFTADIEDAGRILIGHPFNPPHVLPLVEVVPGERTSEDSVQAAVEFYRSAGRTPVVERKEIPGFVGNRLQNALSREAAYLVEQGVITPSDLDTVVTSSLGIRWATTGPFLASHLGGGPGGYRHLMNHIGASMRRIDLGEPSDDSEPLIEAVEQAYGSAPYAELTRSRDRRQSAVLSALELN